MWDTRQSTGLGALSPARPLPDRGMSGSLCTSQGLILPLAKWWSWIRRPSKCLLTLQLLVRGKLAGQQGCRSGFDEKECRKYGAKMLI